MYVSDIKRLPKGFVAEFEDCTNNVYISKKVNGEEYYGSLAFVLDFGELDDHVYRNTKPIKVPDSIIKMAYEWALSKGY